MQQQLKAIETRFKGCRFRSRTEARWAVYFDAIGTPWQYEKEGFDLPSGKYLPDFWLPQVEMWAEVKPVELTPVEYRLAAELAALSQRAFLMLVGPPENKPYWAIEPGGEECSYSLTGTCLDEDRFYSSPCVDDEFPDAGKAVEVARSARFEFGQSGPG
jgi:hypothetical protein